MATIPIKDIHGDPVFFDILEIAGHPKIFCRDCSDSGRHPLPLQYSAIKLVHKCFSEYGTYSETLGKEKKAYWVDDDKLWIELRIIDTEGTILCFIWDETTRPRAGVSETTYVTQTYWEKWQRWRRHEFKAL